MIEINLLPGSAKRTRRRMPKLAVGGLGKAKLPKLNQGLAIMVIAWVIGIGLFAWMFVGGRTRLATLEDQIAAARLDSVRLAQTIATADTLQKRMAAAAGKLKVVQEIDASRYVWAHLLDEAARALPEHTWMVQVSNIAVDSGVMYPKFSLEGRTGNNLALAQYLAQLEQSPFIRNVRMRESQLVREDDKLVYSFLLEAEYEPPPPDIIETVPLFASAPPTDSAVAAPPTSQRAGQTQRAGTPVRRPGTQEQR